MITLGTLSQRVFDPAFRRESFVNFGLAGKTSDNITGWNNVKATSAQVSAGASFTGILDTEGKTTPYSIQVGPASLLERSATIGNPAVDQNVYKTNYRFTGTGGTLTISGLNDARLYKVTIVGGAYIEGMPSVVIYTKCVVNGVELPIQQDHDADTRFDKSLYFIRAEDAQPEGGELEFEFIINTDIYPGIDYTFDLSGLKIEEYVVSTGWQYPIDIVPMGALAFPYAIRVPDVVAATTPLIVSTPMGGTEGLGTGSLQHFNFIFSKTLVKPLLNGEPNIPNDALIVCPQYRVNDWNQGHLADLIDHIIAEYGLNGEHIYLMGFSAGMEVSLAYIGEKHRPVSAAVLGSSPYTAADFPPGTAPDYAAIASTNTPLWLFGSDSDPLVPAAKFLEVRDALLSANPNYPIKVTLFDDDSHHWPMMYVYNGLYPGSSPMAILPGYDDYSYPEHWGWMLRHSYSYKKVSLGSPTIIPQTGMAFAGYWPDGKISVVEEATSPKYTLYWGERTTYRTQGDTVDLAVEKSKVLAGNAVFGTGVSSVPGFTDGGAWLTGVFRQSGNNLIAFFHAESGWGGLEAYKSIGVTYSTDNGLTWSPGQKILSVDYPKPSSPQFSGLGDSCVIYDPVSERFVCYYSAFVTGADYMICMAASDTGASGTWLKWDGSGFTVPGYTEATGVGGADTPIAGLTRRSGANPSVMWNETLGKWVMVYSGWNNALYISASPDGITWETPVRITDGEDARYPNLMGAESDLVGGKTVTLYYGKDQDPVDGTRGFAKRVMTFDALTPDPELPKPTTAAASYTIPTGGSENIPLTNVPSGVFIAEWWAFAPEVGIFLSDETTLRLAPPLTSGPVVVPVSVRYYKDGFVSEWHEITVTVADP